MTIDSLITEAVRQVVREELRAALGDRSLAAGSVLTTEQAAEAAGVAPKTIRAWVAAGLPATRHRRRLAIRRADLDAWRSGEQASTVTLVQSLTRSGG